MSRVAIAAVTVALTGCATEVPTELSLERGAPRIVDDHPGTSVSAMRRACANTMLASAPADHALQVTPKTLAEGTLTVIEVDAVLTDIGMFRQELPVTYRCEYRDGRLTLGTWVRGLPGGNR